MNNSKKYAQSYSRFEQILKKKGITSYRVATDLNFSPMLLSDWKRDKSKPKLDTMIKIASYLDEPVESFVDQKERSRNEAVREKRNAQHIKKH